MTGYQRKSGVRLIVASIGVMLIMPVAAQTRRSTQIMGPSPLAGGPGLFQQLKYRHIGPVGNRVVAVAGVAGNPLIAYAGAASGGIFKTIDGGVRWEPVFDGQDVSSIGSLAIAPSDSNVVWAGTGETFIRSNISIGNGIYRSTDTGKTWTRTGLEKTGRIGRIVIDPRNPDIVFAAALGHCYGPQPERGVFRTVDGGKSWERVLFVDENTGCADIVMDPRNPRILFAAMWQVEIKTWGKFSGGPGSGIFVSRDGGTTWKRLLGRGLPPPPLGKIGLAVAASNPDRVYALIETGDGVPWQGKETSEGVLWRSDDGGENWSLVSSDTVLTQRPHYYTRCAVSPVDENEIYFCALRVSLSLDGGKTTADLNQPGPDNHDIWIDPKNADRILVGHDFGISISLNRGRSWDKIELPIAQMYHVAVDNRVPYYVYGNRQDGPSFRGPSNALLEENDEIPSGMWIGVGGAECGFAVPDPVDNNIVWSGNYGGLLERFDVQTRHRSSASVWPDASGGWPAADLKYRFNWTFPIAISPHDHNCVYVGSQYVHMTTDAGQSWTLISPDLTTNDKSRQQASGGLSEDNLGVEYGCTLFALAESPLEKGVIWAGSNDGLVHVTRDGGKNWTNLAPNFPKLPAWGTVSNIEPSRFEAGKCYVTFDFHQMNNRDPYVYKTADYGRTWTLISTGIPRSMLSYAHCVREDPVRKGLLYLGTENALYLSLDDGENWRPLQTNLPQAPVHWLVVQENFNDLVVATYGRGFWIMDDITPLQQLTAEVLAGEAHLFAPRPAYRFRTLSYTMTRPQDPCAGRNPPFGASINYYLKATPAGEVRISILDEKGDVLKQIVGSKDPGINRLWWDLRYESSTEVRLRTAPLKPPHVALGPEGWRPLLSDGGVTPLAAPGVYIVKVTVGGKEFTQKLVIKPDPNSDGTEEDVRAQVRMLLGLRADSSLAADMINTIEWLRKQTGDLSLVLKDGLKSPVTADVAKAAAAFEIRLIDLEEEFIQVRNAGPRQNNTRFPTRLYDKIAGLVGDILMSDFKPTAQAAEVRMMYQERLASGRRELDRLINEDLVALNRMLKDINVPNIVVVKKF
jgi:photosystem II stability/assembly factor-like uncharacterized protein